MREIHGQQDNRNVLRNHTVPPYFESELGKAFILSQVNTNTQEAGNAFRVDVIQYVVVTVMYVM